MRTPIWRGFTSPYHGAPFLGPQRNGKLGTVQKLFSPSTQAMPIAQSFPDKKTPLGGRVPTACAAAMLSRNWSEQGQRRKS